MPEFGFLKRNPFKSRRTKGGSNASGRATPNIHRGSLDSSNQQAAAGAQQPPNNAAGPSSQTGQPIPSTAPNAVHPAIGGQYIAGNTIGGPVDAGDATVAPSGADIPPIDEPTPELLDISSAISKATDLRDPIKVTTEAMKKVLETAKSRSPLGEKWTVPLRRLLFYHDTLETHSKHLDYDFEVDQTPPPPEPTVIHSLETELNKVYRILCESKTAESSAINSDTDGTSGDEPITKTIADMDKIFEEYTDALHEFATQSIAQFKPDQSQLNQEPATDAQQRAQNVPNVYGKQHLPCLLGTRERTLAAISKWADETADPKPIFLLLDVAGSGKSTVAKHMANKWSWEKRLLARFFFSRDTATTMSTDLFCSTIADAFVAHDRKFEAPIKAFKERPDIGLLSFEEVFNGLVISPLEELNREAILIIDALDECDNEHGSRDELLNTLRGQQFPIPRLRILATGRPEFDIRKWARISGVEYATFIQLEGGQKDVEVYIKHRLQDLPYIQDRLYDVIKDADGVFIWARIACDLILKTANVNRLLEELRTEVTLDFLYRVALEHSIPKDKPSRHAFTVVLQMILAAREPLSMAELERLSPEPGIVEGIVTRLGALLLYKDREDPIRLLHATFREFLTSRAKAGVFFIQPEHGNQTLALGCLSFISNYSSKDDSTLRSLDVTSQRIYVYSSKSWVYHCMASYRKLALNGPILEFAYNRLENWADLADKWYRLDTLSSLRDVLALSRQNTSLKVTEAVVDHGLKTIVRASAVLKSKLNRITYFLS
ncbi:hypothetical protein M408DRAFT_29602 [Serendipita vermifera MAFF 305830]|uniref:Nephrocystin 3-like N-terminal domain-containing protein n=1 Tax=Serendipita vermifera MAFF 305830 TaxID=933852 RepID=A0A0C3AN04_SERVB|nr:hypothetical protein M408DRAFT_29602 [Serendipita vermifera MAFF 305830]